MRAYKKPPFRAVFIFVPSRGYGSRSGAKRAGHSFLNPAMLQANDAVGLGAEVGVVRHHDDGAVLRVQFGEDAQYGLFVFGVEVAGGLVGKEDFRFVNQRAGDADALLFAAGELFRQVVAAVREPDPF